MPETPLAYFITFRTYGTWVAGDARGSVDRLHNEHGTPVLAPNEYRERMERSRMAQPPMVLNEIQRAEVERTMREVAGERHWTLHALNVRANHVHVVCSADVNPEKVMGDFKRWATKRLRERGLVEPDRNIWSVHGSTRYLWDRSDVFTASEYTLNHQ